VFSDHYRFLTKGFECAFHLFIEDVDVDHRGGEIGVAEHLLNQADLARLLVEVTSK